VSVAVDAEGDLVRFSVQDNGPGIATKHLPRLFERFYRVDKARTRAQGGTGLGLAIVKHIASIHGGRVEVTSRVGEGSCFRLLLPRSVVPSAVEAMPIANESGGAI
jgi:two-component system phosphate regulon sensor histidine kinase PhoR